MLKTPCYKVVHENDRIQNKGREKNTSPAPEARADAGTTGGIDQNELQIHAEN